MQLAVETRRQSHPVDVIEVLASSRDLEFERNGEDEIAMTVAGAWAAYSVSFSWMPEIEALHLGCAFEMKVPAHRELEILRLLARVNEHLLVGHFDLWQSEGAIMFRHALVLSGGAQPTDQQAERVFAAALETCERYYQAFHFVVWTGRSAQEALAFAMFETVGSA